MDGGLLLYLQPAVIQLHAIAAHRSFFVIFCTYTLLRQHKVEYR